MPARIKRKILRNGDSKTVALPPDWLRMFNLDSGDDVDMFYSSIVIIKAKDFRIDSDLVRKELDLIIELETKRLTEKP